MRRARWTLLVLALAGCEDPGGQDSAEASSSGDSSESGDACADAPVATWANFGQAFLITNCNACHAAGAIDRHGAPPSVVFDTLDEARAWRARILARAAGEPPTMPPGGGTSEDDRELLEIWLTCDDAR